MTKDISIKEDGVEKSFSGVQRLRVRLVGGGTCDWIPADGIINKTIRDIGTYRAADDNAVGYAVVNVDMQNGDVKYY